MEIIYSSGGWTRVENNKLMIIGQIIEVDGVPVRSSRLVEYDQQEQALNWTNHGLGLRQHR